jgi:hypothetical protein
MQLQFNHRVIRHDGNHPGRHTATLNFQIADHSRENVSAGPDKFMKRNKVYRATVNFILDAFRIEHIV